MVRSSNTEDQFTAAFMRAIDHAMDSAYEDVIAKAQVEFEKRLRDVIARAAVEVSTHMDVVFDSREVRIVVRLPERFGDA